MAQLQSTSITGSLIVTGGITGSLLGTSSFALTASYALNAGDSVWTGSGGNIYYNGGNVGIGTTTPTRKLQVTSGDILIDNDRGYFAKNTGGSELSLIKFDTSNNCQIGSVFQGGTTIVYSTTNTLFYSYPGSVGTENMRITTAGNVGIGTTNPTARLQVKGSGATSATTALRVENTNASASMVVLDDGNVGIGTTSPSVKLQVDGTISSTGTLTAYTSVPSINIGHDGATAFIAATSGGGANSGISFSVGNNNEKMRITSDGNVGIGTTNPGYPLDIVGFANSTSGFRVTDGTIDNRISWSSGNVGFFGTVSNHPIAFNTNLSERMLITAGGNVGIGTTSPTSRLQVKGSGATSATTALRVENSNASSSFTVKDDGLVAINTTSALVGGEKLAVNGIIASTGLQVYGSPIYMQAADPYFAMYDNSTSTSINFQYTAGKLNINKPLASLTVSGPTVLSGSLTVTSGITGSLLGTASYAIQALSASYAPSTPAFPYTGSALITGSLDVEGNLGVTGSINFSGFGSLYMDNGLIYIDTAQTSYIGYNAPGIQAYTPTQYYFQAGSGNYLFTSTGAIISSGSAVSPSKLLYLCDTVSTDAALKLEHVDPLAGSTTAEIGVSAFGGFSLNATSNSALTLGTNNTERARIDTTGNFGIGTILPAQKLDVALGHITTYDSNTQEGKITFKNNASAVRWDHSSQKLHLTVNTRDKLTIETSAGYVGINQTSPLYQLDVNGSTNVTGSLTVTGSLNVFRGSLTVGNITSTPSTENSLNVYPPLAGGTGEGGQILLAASGGLYSSASMLDTWQDQFRILRGSNTGGSNAGLVYVNLQSGNTQFTGAVTASAYSGLPNDYLYATRSGSSQTVGSAWANTDVVFNNVSVSKGISFNTSTGVASLTGGKVYRVTARLAWGAAASYNLQFSCFTSANTQIGPTTEIIQSTNGTNNISDGTLDFIYAPGSNTDIKIRCTNNNTALSGETIRADLNTQFIIQQIA